MIKGEKRRFGLPAHLDIWRKLYSYSHYADPVSLIGIVSVGHCGTDGETR
jgi:hypothetical protein